SGGDSSLMAVENCAESATTATPQIRSTGTRTTSGWANRRPTVKAQSPDTNIATLVIRTRPHWSARFPKNQHPGAPIPTTANVTRGAAPDGSPGTRADSLAAMNAPIHVHTA